MADINQGQAAPPAGVPTPPGQPAGTGPQDGQTPPAAGNDQPSGGVSTQGEQTATISIEELNALKRKAGRWEASLKRNREGRKGSSRRSKSDYNADDLDPALAEVLKDRDEKIDELSSVNIKLAVKDKVRDLLDSDEYKEISQGIRRAIIRNPLGFANPTAQSVEEAVADIQDYLDDELDRLASTTQTPAQGAFSQPGVPQPQAPGQPAGTPPGQPPQGRQTPPVAGSGPSNPQVDVNQGIDGKTGSKRSTQVLQNILKGQRR